MSNTTTTERVAPSRNGQRAPAPAPAQPEDASRKKAGRRVLTIAAVAVVVLAAALTAGTLPRLGQEHKINEEAAAAASTPPRVAVALAQRAAAAVERELPGNSLPLLEAALYARATGYIESRLVDIGDAVTKGQLLAVIAAPDIDDQLTQAKANLAQSKANLALAQANARLGKVTLARDISLGSSVAPQQVDQDRAAAETSAAQVEAARATIRVNEAAVQRYTDLQGFEKIVAPFPGIITARSIDPGDLVSADNTTRELFHLMRTDILRVFVNVPQVFAVDVKVGQEAVVTMRENPQKPFTGKVTRTANALDPNTRTLLTEVQVQNPDGALRPGMYLQVNFVFQRAVAPVLIPSAALATRTGAPRVGVLDAQQKVHYRKVQLGRDFGATVEVLAGLSAGERVIVHPGDDLPDGTTVEPVTPEKNPPS